MSRLSRSGGAEAPLSKGAVYQKTPVAVMAPGSGKFRAFLFTLLLAVDCEF